MTEYYYNENAYTWDLVKKLNEPPVLLYALSGFMDAGFVAGQIISSTLQNPNSKSELLIEFSNDMFMDYKERRGFTTYENGVIKGVDYPSVKISLCFDKNKKPFLLLYGPEPYHNWEIFGKLIIKIMKRAKCKIGIGMGGFPAPVPHTRNLIVAKTATKRTFLSQDAESDKGYMSLPASVSSQIEWEIKQKKLMGWTYNIKVPSYFADQIYPNAAIALARKIEENTGLEFFLEKIEKELPKFNKFTKLEIRRIPELSNLTEKYEKTYDATYYEGSDVTRKSTILKNDLPSTNELLEQINDFLKKQNNNTHHLDRQIDTLFRK